MMVMTAKVDFKKILIILAATAALILGIILLLGGENTQTGAKEGVSAATNEGRIQFLKGFGWEVTPTPTQSGQVTIPEAGNQVFSRYNTLQKGQGYDLSDYAGQNVMRYVYQVNNYPGATAPVYATLLVCKDQVIGGDVTNTAAGGKISGFKQPEPTASAPTVTAPGESTPESGM